MQNNNLVKSIILSLSILLSFTLLGFFIFKGLKTFSDKDRIVTVKGLAEMNVMATSATIVIDFSISGDDLQQIIKKTELKKEAIITHLTNLGYQKSSIEIDNIGVNDKERYHELRWQDGQQVSVKIDRYTITQQLSLEIPDIKDTENKASQIKLDLISKDLTSNIESIYSFPELNSIKPELIAASTKNARIAGEQFANDSQAKLGKIKTASQGQITIAGRYYFDEEEINNTNKEPYTQKARVVSTIVFFLE